MAAAGFAPEDYDCDVIDVWPENWDTVQFFLSLPTQWRYGMSGRTGLDYTAVLAMLREMRLPREQRDRIFAGVQVMEIAALEEMNKK